VLITFSGLDGAGKSTLIEWLKQTLERQDRGVAVFHMNDHVGAYAYLRMLRDRLLGGPPSGFATLGDPDPRRVAASATEQARRPSLRERVWRARIAILWNKPLRRVLYLFDLIVFWLYRLRIEKAQRQILIMDRYFYDTLVDVSDGRHWFWIRLLARITPTPELPVFLDISPEESYSRKGEYSVEYLRARWAAYKTVFPWVRSSVTLPNDDLNAAKATLQRVVTERLGSR
jgi:thymidylate kinase